MIYNDQIEAGKFYKVTGTWDFDGNGSFPTVYSSNLCPQMEVFGEDDKSINAFYNAYKTLIDEGYFEMYYKNGKAELYIAGDFKNSKFVFPKNDVCEPLWFDENFKENLESVGKIKEISQNEFNKKKMEAKEALVSEVKIILNEDEDLRTTEYENLTLKVKI